MPIFSGQVLNGEYDYHISTQDGSPSNTATGTSVIQASRVNSVLPGTTWIAYCELITSGITGENVVITGATFHWYDNDYTKSKDTTFQGTVQVFSGASGQYQPIYTFTTDPGTAWNSHDFESHEWGNLEDGQTIVLTGDGLTKFRFAVTDPGGSYDRTWEIGAYEGSRREAWLEIFYTTGATVARKARRFIIIG